MKSKYTAVITYEDGKKVEFQSVSACAKATGVSFIKLQKPTLSTFTDRNGRKFKIKITQVDTHYYLWDTENILLGTFTRMTAISNFINAPKNAISAVIKGDRSLIHHKYYITLSKKPDSKKKLEERKTNSYKKGDIRLKVTWKNGKVEEFDSLVQFVRKHKLNEDKIRRKLSDANSSSDDFPFTMERIN